MTGSLLSKIVHRNLSYLSDSSTELALQDPLQGLEFGRGQLPAPLQSVQKFDHPTYV